MKIEFYYRKWFQGAPRFYWIPQWLNCITWKPGDSKAYRWLFFGWIVRP